METMRNCEGHLAMWDSTKSEVLNVMYSQRLLKDLVLHDWMLMFVLGLSKFPKEGAEEGCCLTTQEALPPIVALRICLQKERRAGCVGRGTTVVVFWKISQSELSGDTTMVWASVHARIKCLSSLLTRVPPK